MVTQSHGALSHDRDIIAHHAGCHYSGLEVPNSTLGLQVPEKEINYFPLFLSEDSFPVIETQESTYNYSHNHLDYNSSQMPAGIVVPQEPLFVTDHCASSSFYMWLCSAGFSSTSTDIPATIARSNTSTDGGTYTCTYHSCTLRFESLSLLKKHKREAHRQRENPGSPRIRGGTTSGLLHTQAGPHRCDRINPNTGSPCDTVFSRPYDLTRHEDTIHNPHKQKTRCDLCNGEKTFNRADALRRHYRVRHPDMEPPGKLRRQAEPKNLVP
ncbi:hypothetical protein BGZ63DRAFT_435494 [Mariannaea sp. PMI_226]|nr:hypothetical protein BGZ63DRAFT_435494 [Mariannaea sp. PMI_226]